MTCERCRVAPPLVVAIDMPEQDGALMFGHLSAGRVPYPGPDALLARARRLQERIAATLGAR